ncbi:gamma-glutamyltransferase [Marinifilum sp. D714]|uniref:gamma-glutamyltransferase n=1 Tax=Marinifilum sp. D714 TaxID=2937523 RepID=UPI0027BBE4B1|nr:gamma-glutamyltransferase [Marinifilum sp. D714]MDQ2179779.1 gamma-glutamyltransferase [Marinifilum sp. D714]
MKLNKTLSVIISLFLLLACNQKNNLKSDNIFKNGVVVTAHYLASEVGTDILKQGGNAFDAAVAVQFALAVVYPRAGNIGGGGFAVIRTAKGESISLDFREKAPKASFEDMYLDSLGNVIDGLSQTGHLAVGVPGSVDGMVNLHQKYGKLTWTKLLQPAIDLAREGIKLSKLEADKLNAYRERICEVNSDKYDCCYVCQKDFQVGELLVNKDLEEVLIRIRDKGRDGFYSGKTADLIVEEIQNGNGLITYADLKDYKSIWRPALVGNYRDCKIISMPPPSSGGIALLQLLKGAEIFDFQKYSPGSFEHIHLMVELERRVYADRATWLGDPDYCSVPVNKLLSEDYLVNRFSNIGMDKKSNSQEIKAGNVEVIESFETTHFSIVDKWGNAVSVTTTLNGNYGSKVIVKGGGFFLNNEMDDFSIKPGVPNQFGLVGGKANAIEPEKRMLSSMTPTIIEKNGKLFMVTGSPGGSTIITSVFQNIINAVEFKMNPQDCVNAPRIHSQWLPDKVYAEIDAISPSVKRGLQDLGHVIQEQSRIGMMANIAINGDGLLVGAPDTLRHKDSRAIGY